MYKPTRKTPGDRGGWSAIFWFREGRQWREALRDSEKLFDAIYSSSSKSENDFQSMGCRKTR
jgi:hypothetical protein